MDIIPEDLPAWNDLFIFSQPILPRTVNALLWFPKTAIWIIYSDIDKSNDINRIHSELS